MADIIGETLKQVHEQIMSTEVQINHAKELLSILEEAGEPTSDLREQLAQLERRRMRWIAMLRSRGFEV